MRGMLFLFLLLAGGGETEGYKIRRTDCSMADTTVMVCTCGGIGDPYSIIMNKVRPRFPRLHLVIMTILVRARSLSWVWPGTGPATVTIWPSR